MLKIRKARKGDVAQMVPIWVSEYGKPPYNEKWPEKRARKKIRDYMKEDTVFVAVSGGKVIGFIIGRTEYWHDGYHGQVDELVVSDEYQGKGVGTALMDRMERLFRSKGIKNMSLYTSPKAKAMDFYRKKGFKEAEYVILEKEL